MALGLSWFPLPLPARLSAAAASSGSCPAFARCSPNLAPAVVLLTGPSPTASHPRQEPRLTISLVGDSGAGQAQPDRASSAGRSPGRTRVASRLLR